MTFKIQTTLDRQTLIARQQELMKGLAQVNEQIANLDIVIPPNTSKKKQKVTFDGKQILPTIEHYTALYEKLASEQEKTVWNVRSNAILVFCMKAFEGANKPQFHHIALQMLLIDKKLDDATNNFNSATVPNQISKLTLAVKEDKLVISDKDRTYSLKERGAIESLTTKPDFDIYSKAVKLLSKRSFNAVLQQVLNTIARKEAEMYLEHSHYVMTNLMTKAYERIS